MRAPEAVTAMQIGESTLRRHLTILTISASVVAVLGGCSGATDQTAPNQTETARMEGLPANTFDTSTSIKELMDSTVDPAADVIWGSVATVSDENGVNKRQPRTPEEWKEVRRHAVTLIEAMNLVMMKGRRAAPAGTPPKAGELAPEQIDALLKSDPETLAAFARNMQTTTRSALAAIDKRDPAALFEAGSAIDRACESCHMTFWYPDIQDPRLQHLKNR